MEYGLRFLSFLQVLIDFLLRPLFWWIEKTPPNRIPANDDPLLRISATKLAKMIRNKELKSEVVVRAYIQRMREVNPVVNAVVEDRYETAVREAKTVDDAISVETRTPQQMERDVPLNGVPMTVKESCSVEGMSLSVGSLSRVGIRATADGDAVSLLRRAGAIFLGVTNTPELCLSWDSVNLVSGRTVNPYNTYRTSGGSSGGEGALLGSGASIIGIGSDLAGSIRVPAQFNGIFGHKPTGGIVSIKGHYPNSTDDKFAEYLVLGPMTRYAEDLVTMMKIMAGENASMLQLDTKVDLGKLNIFYMEDVGPSICLIPVQKEIKMAIKKSVNHLKWNCKSNVNETKFKELSESIELSVSVFFSVLKDVPNILQNPANPKENGNLLAETLKSIFGLSRHSLNALLFYALKETNSFIPRSRNPGYMKQFNEFHKKIEKTLGTDGVFLFPTFPTEAFNHFGIFTKITGVMYTMIFNLMGFPSTHVPLGLANNGLPIGMQVIAAQNQDRLCLAVAQELEAAFGGWIPPPMN